MKGFIDFIRKQGVVGFAVGFMIGSAMQKLVTAFVQDLINPILGILFSATGNLTSAYFQIGSAKIMWGDFVNALIDFLVITLTVYLFVKTLGLERLDKKG